MYWLVFFLIQKQITTTEIITRSIMTAAKPPPTEPAIVPIAAVLGIKVAIVY